MIMMNLARIKRRHQQIRGRLLHKYNGKRVSLQTGKYAGREAMITDVIIDFNGDVLFSAVPFNLRHVGLLLTDADAVRYRRRGEFKIIYGEGR